LITRKWERSTKKELNKKDIEWEQTKLALEAYKKGAKAKLKLNDEEIPALHAGYVAE
jgi:hypothetical protein